MFKKKKIIFTAGSFDICHSGHLNILIKAKAMGDELIVAISTNRLIKKYKQIYPILNYAERRKMIQALRVVDKVVKQSRLLDINQIKRLKIDLVVLGSDWQNRDDVPSIVWLKKHNKIVFLPYTRTLSSSKIKEKIIRHAYDIVKSQTKRKSC